MTDQEILYDSAVIQVLPAGETYPESGIAVIQAVDGKKYKFCANELGWFLEPWHPRKYKKWLVERLGERILGWRSGRTSEN